MRLVLFTLESEEALKENASRTMWNPAINASAGSPNKREQDAGRTPYTPGRELLLEHLNKGGEQLWVGRAQAAMVVGLGFPAALLQPDDIGTYLRGLPTAGGRMLLTAR